MKLTARMLFYYQYSSCCDFEFASEFEIETVFLYNQSSVPGDEREGAAPGKVITRVAHGKAVSTDRLASASA